MKKSTRAAAFLVGILSGIMVMGCRNDGPVSGTVSDHRNNPAIAESDCGVVTPISLPRSRGPKPVVTASVIVTPQKGGRVDTVMQYMNASTGQIVLVHAILSVPAGGVNGTKTITMTIDTSVVGVKFGPQGLRFLRVSLFSLEAYNLDPIPSGANIGFYFFDDVGGKEPESWSSMRVTPTSIKMAGGTVPHFSRYAFGR